VDREAFLERLASLRETRARLPELVRNRHASRRRRSVAGHSGRLVLVEADDPGAASLGAGGDPSALADRGELLWRITQALQVRGVDGVIATADIVDDLLLLEQLEDRLAIGTMNRGGLAGSVFELDDRFTGYDAQSVAASHLDGGKVRLRIDPSDPATAGVIEAAGHAVSGLSSHGVLALVEPSWCTRGTGGLVEDRSSTALMRAVDVASALGARSPYTWLALPVVDDLPEVLAATTLPVLLRPDAVSSVDEARQAWGAGLALTGARGLVLPAGALYPDHGDELALVEAAAEVVHEAVERGRGR
jgi:hypothetical protein